MKWLLLSLIFVMMPLHAGEGDYLKVRTYPKYPLPGEATERTIQLSISPRFPSDAKFSALCTELAGLSAQPSARSVPMHEATISFEARLDGKVIEVSYAKSKVAGDASTGKRWENVFQLLRELSSEQFNP